jgi:hypothetical protein
MLHFLNFFKKIWSSNDVSQSHVINYFGKRVTISLNYNISFGDQILEEKHENSSISQKQKGGWAKSQISTTVIHSKSPINCQHCQPWIFHGKSFDVVYVYYEIVFWVTAMATAVKTG